MVQMFVLLSYCRTCTQVPGGHVEHLAAAWETQRRYGGVARPKVAGEDGEAAPPFRHFVPGGVEGAGEWWQLHGGTEGYVVSVP